MERMEQTISNINNVEIKDNEIELPYMREELLGCIRRLQDTKYQEREWLQESRNYKFYSSLRMIINFLLNDFDLDIEIESSIGNIIRNKEEAEIIFLVVKAIDDITNEIGIM